MTKTKSASIDSTSAPAPNPSRRDRLQALLFSAGAMGTAIAALSVLAEVKIPKVQGE